MGQDDYTEENSWRRAIENQAFCDKVMHLLTELGNNLEVAIRISPTTPFFRVLRDDEDDLKHPAQQRLDNYFRDEIISSKGSIR